MRRSAIGLVLCMSTGMAFGEVEGINPVLNESFSFRLGAYFMKLDGNLGSGTDDRELPDIDLDTLGIDDEETSPYFAARWRATDRWQFKFDYFGLDSSGDVTRPFLDFGDIGAVGTLRAETKLKTDFYIVQAGYSLLKREKAELGLGLGVHLVDLDSSLRVTAAAGPVMGNVGTESTDVLAPLPNLFGYGTYAFTPKLSLDASLAYFSLSYDKYDGSLFRGTINLEYRFTDHIGAGIGYNYADLRLDIEEDDDITTEYSIEYTGPLVFLSAGF